MRPLSVPAAIPGDDEVVEKALSKRNDVLSVRR
jgi:hypothetical protein